ncbi:MAG: ATP-binding cassette domain-containing protein [Bryobacteraceae bacterium]
MIEARIRQHFPARPGSAAFTLDVTFEAGGGVTVLFGRSGAGKTLTLDSIAGFVRPREGRIAVGGAVLYDAATGVNLPPRDRHCGYVFQNYALFPHRTLRENLDFAAERLPKLERYRRVSEMLERFRLGDLAGRRPHELSGGQKQRCSIARALLAAPKVLLLDEPARGLDPELRAELYAVLRQVRAEFAMPVLLVTHDLDECFELGDQMLVLHEGRLVQSGAPRHVLEQPAGADVARLLGRYNLLAAEVRSLDPGRNTSVVRYGDTDLAGPYFPGRFKGDRVTLYVRPELLTARPRDGRLGANQVAMTLESATERPESVRLDFDGGVSVVMPRLDFERYKAHSSKEWAVEFPSAWLRVL